MSVKQLKEAFAKKSLNSAIIDIDGVGKVMVRELTLGDLDSVDYDGTSDARAKNVALAIYTEDGKERIFNPEDANDVEIIKRLGNRVINQITSALTQKN